MNFMRKMQVTSVVVACVALSGCDSELRLPTLAETDDVRREAPSAAPDVASGDVAPDAAPDGAVQVDEMAGVGVWDGRKTRAGVWVAHRDAPRVTSAENLPWVRISNRDTGLFVRGRLYARSTEAQGPDFLVSADAARALGLVAGAPAALEVSAAPALDPSEEKGAQPSDAVPQKAYVHLGVFREERLAQMALAELEAQELPAQLLTMEANPPFFKLILGPAKTYGQRAEFLHKSRQLGYSDAYFIALD